MTGPITRSFLMPNPSIVRFDYDPTGVNPDNLVSNEIHNLTSNFVRAFAPVYGPFFADSVVLFDNANDRQLVRGVDYSITELNQDVTLRLGKEISSVVLVLNVNVSSAVRMTYQVLGGLYQNQADAIANMYSALIQDNRPIAWENVLGKPLAFPPTLHLHNLEDVYGFEPVVNAVERIRSAIILSDVPAFEALIDWVNSRITGIAGDLTTEIAARISGDNNLASALQQEINNRVAGDNNLLALIQAETANRISADATKQPLLGFTPVQQGGGVGQLTNKVYLGWGSNSRVKITIDSTDMGNIVFDAQLGNYLPLSGGTVYGLLISGPIDANTYQNDSSCSLRIQNNGGTGDAGAAVMSFVCSNSYAIKLHLRSDGYFGVGGWSRPMWSWYTDPSGNMISAGNVGAYSDERLKENFTKIDNPFDVINALQGYAFTWNDRSKLIQNKWYKPDVGFKAQDVKNVLELAVSPAIHDDENDETYDVVAYDKLIPYHNEAIKILEARIAELESKVSIIDTAIAKYTTVKDKVKTFISKVMKS